MLIEQLRNDRNVGPFIGFECRENTLYVGIADTVSPEDLLIIKVDSYYNATIHNNDRPKSPDCLIIQRCGEDRYVLHIVELRDIEGPGGFTVKEIEEKFVNCIEDFMSERFGNYFHNEAHNIDRIKLVFVSDPYGFKHDPEKRRKMRGHKIDLLLQVRIPKIFGLHLYIQHELEYTISNCREEAA
ncbi:MAG: hypothetical protein V4649_11850 [Bacteroidota bacterium]